MENLKELVNKLKVISENTTKVEEVYQILKDSKEFLRTKTLMEENDKLFDLYDDIIDIIHYIKDLENISLVEDKVLSYFYTKFKFKDLTVEKLYIGKREFGECPMCGDKLIKDTRQIKFKRKNDTNIVITLSGEYCDNCGESFHSDDDLEGLQEKLKSSVNKEVFSVKNIPYLKENSIISSIKE